MPAEPNLEVANLLSLLLQAFGSGGTGGTGGTAGSATPVAVYHAAPVTRTDGAPGTLEVDSQGRLLVALTADVRVDIDESQLATGAQSDAANALLTSLDTKATNLATATKQDTTNTLLTAISGFIDGLETQGSSIDGKLTGLATSAKQDAHTTLLTAIAGFVDGLETSITSLDTKQPVKGGATVANSTPVNIASDQVVPISAAALPLPAGAATAAGQATSATNQAAGNTSLANLDTKTPAKGASTIANSSPVNIASDQIVPISAAALPLPAGAATTAIQTTQQTSLTSMDGKIPAKGGATIVGSTPVNIASDQIVPISAAALPLPAGAATAANQGTANASLSSVDTKIGAAVTGDNQASTSLGSLFARLVGWDGANFQRLRAGVTTLSTVVTGVLNTLPWAIYHLAPVTRTDGQGGPLETDASGNLRVSVAASVELASLTSIDGRLTAQQGPNRGVNLWAIAVSNTSTMTDISSGTQLLADIAAGKEFVLTAEGGDVWYHFAASTGTISATAANVTLGSTVADYIPAGQSTAPMTIPAGTVFVGSIGANPAAGTMLRMRRVN